MASQQHKEKPKTSLGLRKDKQLRGCQRATLRLEAHQCPKGRSPVHCSLDG